MREQKLYVMKHFILIASLLVTFANFGQTSGQLVIFSNYGEKFFVILNGIQQNQQAETNVRIDGLPEGWYSCRILSENNLFSFTQNLGVGNNIQSTYQLIEKKGAYKLRYYSETPLNTPSATGSTPSTIVYHTEPLPTTTTTTQTTVTQTTTSSPSTIQTQTNVGGSSSTETVNVNIGMTGNGVTTEVYDSETGTYETIDMNIGISGTGINTEVIETGTHNETINMDVNVNGTTSTQTTGTTYTQTTTTTTTTTQQNASNNQNAVLNYSNCIVDDAGMAKMLEMIKTESFSDDKMRVAKQFAKNRCLTVNQVKQVANLFSFSEDKMEIVKYAYTNCINKNDYYEVQEVFTFSGDKEELERFLNQ